MDTVLRSDELLVSVNKKGAELSSIKSASGKELLWTAETDIWPRHAPVLFPIVGKLKDNQYELNGKYYTLPQHGFARDADFELVKTSTGYAHFRLTQNENSKNVYPFDFELNIIYTLEGNTLDTSYSIHNPSAGNILFSIGAHPGFMCPIRSDETFEDYYLEFEHNAYTIRLLENGLRAEQTTSLIVPDRKLRLSTTLFSNDALVFENSQVGEIALRSSKSKYAVVMKCRNWPYFGIWSKKNCREFVCLEPWHGIADSGSHGGDFEKKEGVIELKKGDTFNCHFSLCFQGP